MLSPLQQWANLQAKNLAANRGRQERELQLERRLADRDRFHEQIFDHAIERVATILSHKEHYLATQKKEKNEHGTPAKRKWTKKAFCEQLVLNPGRAHGHIWVVHLGRYRCSACRVGMRMPCLGTPSKH